MGENLFPRRRALRGTGERALLLAVLGTACRDLAKLARYPVVARATIPLRARRWKVVREWQDLQDWFRAEEHDGLCSFVGCCEALGLDADVVRWRLRRLGYLQPLRREGDPDAIRPDGWSAAAAAGNWREWVRLFRTADGRGAAADAAPASAAASRDGAAGRMIGLRS